MRRGRLEIAGLTVVIAAALAATVAHRANGGSAGSSQHAVLAAVRSSHLRVRSLSPGKPGFCLDAAPTTFKVIFADTAVPFPLQRAGLALGITGARTTTDATACLRSLRRFLPRQAHFRRVAADLFVLPYPPRRRHRLAERFPHLTGVTGDFEVLYSAGNLIYSAQATSRQYAIRALSDLRRVQSHLSH